jgi:hypothetical protein
MLGTLLLFSTLWVSPPGHAGETADFVIGYLEQSGDPRYSGSLGTRKFKNMESFSQLALL